MVPGLHMSVGGLEHSNLQPQVAGALPLSYTDGLSCLSSSQKRQIAHVTTQLCPRTRLDADSKELVRVRSVVLDDRFVWDAGLFQPFSELLEPLLVQTEDDCVRSRRQIAWTGFACCMCDLGC